MTDTISLGERSNSKVDDLQDSRTTASGNSSANRITIDIGKGVMAVAICAAFCGLAVAISIWAAYTARDAETESRLTQYYLMDPHSRTPDELAAWIKFQHEHEKR